MKNNKKGQLGLGTVKLFILGIMIITVLAFVTIIAITEVRNSQTKEGITVNNETLTVVNETGSSLSVAGLQGVQCTYVRTTNETHLLTNPASNYSLSTNDCVLVFQGTAGDLGYNNTAVNITYTYTHDYQDGIGGILGNVTNGTTSFFGEAVTWFTLLAVVVIILIIAIVILAVNRFSDSGLSSGGSSGGGVPAGGGL